MPVPNDVLGAESVPELFELGLLATLLEGVDVVEELLMRLVDYHILNLS